MRRYPVILDWLADGSLTVTTVRVLRPVLTPENHLAVLTEARHRSKKEAELFVARLKPQPDVPSSIRKLSVPTPVTSPTVAATPQDGENPAPLPPVVLPAPAHRPVVVPLAPERYRVQFTVSKETHDKLRRVQDLLCREVAKGDPAVIFDRALDLLLREVERKKIAATTKPRGPPRNKAGLARHLNLFADVPQTNPFCRWVEELANRDVDRMRRRQHCPTASVTREQMGVFISVTFGLALYGL